MSGRFVRLAETERARIQLTIDGRSVAALQGDNLLVAMLTAVDHVRDSEFGDGRRAGFCMMGACQDCWVWTEAGDRLRACTTPAVTGLCILTTAPGAEWPTRK
jgi:aerobic-type carbon monoxide dehydrogenase small subunit (CoxS/CutS family)